MLLPTSTYFSWISKHPNLSPYFVSNLQSIRWFESVTTPLSFWTWLEAVDIQTKSNPNSRANKKWKWNQFWKHFEYVNEGSMACLRNDLSESCALFSCVLNGCFFSFNFQGAVKKVYAPFQCYNSRYTRWNATKTKRIDLQKWLNFNFRFCVLCSFELESEIIISHSCILIIINLKFLFVKKV